MNLIDKSPCQSLQPSPQKHVGDLLAFPKPTFPSNYDSGKAPLFVNEEAAQTPDPIRLSAPSCVLFCRRAREWLFRYDKSRTYCSFQDSNFFVLVLSDERDSAEDWKNLGTKSEAERTLVLQP